MMDLRSEKVPADESMNSLIKLSRLYGGNPRFVIAGGGNTSMKRDGSIFVKASGYSLADINRDGFVAMDRNGLLSLLDSQFPNEPFQREEILKSKVLSLRLHPEQEQRPSVECILHSLIQGKYVVHTHSTFANMLTCCIDGKKHCRKLFAEEVIWIPYADPGLLLAREVYAHLMAFQSASGKTLPLAIMMQNHGLIISGDSPEEIIEKTNSVIYQIHNLLKMETGVCETFGDTRSMTESNKKKLIPVISPALRALLSYDDKLPILTFNDSEIVRILTDSSNGKKVALAGPMTPDQIVYCKSLPLWLPSMHNKHTKEIIDELSSSVIEYRKNNGYAPINVIVQGLGLFSTGKDLNAAENAGKVYADAIEVMAGAKILGGINYMSSRDSDFIENWEVESYRRKVSAGENNGGRVEGKVAIVTGAAQGLGFEIAKDLARQGAHVALCDINYQGVEESASIISKETKSSKSFGVLMNVSDADSVEEAIYLVVRLFGGIDIFVSNAGVLKAGSVKTQPVEDFDFVTTVNYKGFFICVQKASPVMAVQHYVRPDLWMDIVQINSKSGLTGSNKNSAYSGSKFGGIGLTQSFALELIEDGIKANAICPGNFFDGPLWSHPEHGLFVQYLKTGKVPGAKTIEDVRKAYEAKIPMGRGCEISDVMKAIYYVLEQRYETGQAIPVTGGQVMLG